MGFSGLQVSHLQRRTKAPPIGVVPEDAKLRAWHFGGAWETGAATRTLQPPLKAQPKVTVTQQNMLDGHDLRRLRRHRQVLMSINSDGGKFTHLLPDDPSTQNPGRSLVGSTYCILIHTVSDTHMLT